MLKKGESLNEKMLSWHLLEDVLGWAVILVGGIIIYVWKFYLLDPIMTIGLTVFVIYNVAKTLKEAINILLQGVPKHINHEAVKNDLTAIKGVIEIHDIHIWLLEGETNVFTVHVVLDNNALKNEPEQTRVNQKNTPETSHRTLNNRNRKQIPLYRHCV